MFDLCSFHKPHSFRILVLHLQKNSPMLISKFQNFSPFYIDGIALGEQGLGRILDDISLSIDDVAEQLIGGIR